MANHKSLELLRQVYDQNNGDKQQLIKALKRLLEKAQKMNDYVLIGAVYYDIAHIYNSLSDLNNSLISALKSLAFLEKTKEYELLAKVHIILSYVYGEQENHQISFIESDKAYQIVKKHRIQGDTRITAINNLATSYRIMGDFKTSIKMIEECIELGKKDTPIDYSGLAMHTLNLANFYKGYGKLDKAKEILDSLDSWIDKVSFEPLVCDYYLRRAVLAFEMNQQEEAIRDVDQSFNYFPEKMYPHALYDDYREVCGFLATNKDWKRADKLLEAMRDFAENNDDTAAQIIAIRTFADYYQKYGDYEKATSYYKKLDDLYVERLDEMSLAQLSVNKRIKDADIEIQKLSKEMRINDQLAALEPMTKLLNRSGLLSISSNYIETATKKKQKVGAIFIDIDFFKECNDTYGHTTGDEIIKIVANTCKQEEINNVKFARYGGDEFFGITLGLKDEEVMEIAKKIAHNIQNLNIPHSKNPNGQRITLSIGVANVSISDRADTILAIVNYADKAVYHAKSQGKNAIYFLKYDGEDEKDKSAEYIKIDF